MGEGGGRIRVSTHPSKWELFRLLARLYLVIPNLDFAMTFSKGDYVPAYLLGKNFQGSLFQTFITAAFMKNYFPVG
jgi:hypothetical protein